MDVEGYLLDNYDLVMKNNVVKLGENNYIKFEIEGDKIFVIYHKSNEGHSRFGVGTDFIDNEMSLIGIKKKFNLFNF